MRLVSHGWGKRCELCERHSHAKWHEIAKCELNPVALIEFIEGMHSGDSTTKALIAAYVFAVTGIDYDAMQRVLVEERKAADAGHERHYGTRIGAMCADESF